MGSTPANKLIDLIRGHTLRVRTAILLLPEDQLGQEEVEAVRLQVEPVDIRKALLASLPTDTRMVGLTAEKVETLLDQIADSSGVSDCALVINFDLLLSRLKQANRRMVWEYLFSTMPHRRRGIIIAMPETANELLPTATDLERWNQENRLLRYQ